MTSPFPFPIASGKKKVVQQFDCPKETWKNRTMSTESKVGDDKPKISLAQEIRQEFNDTLESVKEFANANLLGKEKKLNNTKRIIMLGGKAEANRSVPYKVLIGLKTKGVQRKKRREEALKATGIVKHKSKDKKVSSTREKKKNVDYGLQATKGRFRNGVLNVKSL